MCPALPIRATVSAAVLIAAVSFCINGQTSIGGGMTCYNRSGQKVPCPGPGPAPSRPPVSTTPSSPPADNSARIEAERRAAEERRRREEAARAAAEAERQRIERERQEQFERDKQNTIKSLKGNTSGSDQLKGGSSEMPLKTGTTPDPQLKTSSTDYNQVRKPSHVVAGVRGGVGDQNADPEWLARRFVEILDAMDKLTSERGWSDAERMRLLEYFKDPGLDPDTAEIERMSADPAAIRDIWADIKSRDEWTGALAPPITAVGPQVFRESWSQTGNTCTLYALASASSGGGFTSTRSIFEVFGKAKDLIKQAEWRDPKERADPDATIKTGLNGMELAYIAESLGSIRKVGPAEFKDIIISGKPVMVHLASPRGNVGHQVVLSRTFKKDGKVWFEMIDSNQTNAWQRRYLNETELRVLIREKGMVFTPDGK